MGSSAGKVNSDSEASENSMKSGSGTQDSTNENEERRTLDDDQSEETNARSADEANRDPKTNEINSPNSTNESENIDEHDKMENPSAGVNSAQGNSQEIEKSTAIDGSQSQSRDMLVTGEQNTTEDDRENHVDSVNTESEGTSQETGASLSRSESVQLANHRISGKHFNERVQTAEKQIQTDKEVVPDELMQPSTDHTNSSLDKINSEHSISCSTSSQASQGLEKDEDNLETPSCYLCGTTYKDPRLLPCFHTFCYQCLFKYTMKHITENKVKCPLCDTLNTVPAIGVRGFDQNTFLLTNESPKQCGTCKDSDDRMVRCDICDQNLCSRCLDFHLDSFPDHNTYPVAMGSSENCKTHHQSNSLICFQCNITICEICNVTSHKMHEVGDCNPIAVKQKRDLLLAIENGKKSQNVMDAKAHIENQMMTIKAMENNAYNSIDEQAKVLHSYVETCRENLRNEASNYFNNLHSQSCNEGANRLIKNIEGRIWYAERFCQLATEGDLATKGQSLNRYLNESLKQEMEVTKIDKDLRFIGQKTSTTEIAKHFGEIVIRDRTTKLTNVHKVFSTISTSVRGVTVSGLHPAGEGCVWACMKTKLELLDKQGTILSSTDIGCLADDVAVAQNGTLFLSCPSRKRIVSVASNGKGKTFLKTDMCPRGLAIDENENIILCEVEKDTFFNFGEGAEAQVSSISTGREQNTIICEGLQYPARVAFIKDMSIVVISDWVQQAVIAIQDGREIGCYKGNPSISDDFVPRGVCCTTDGDVVVVDIAMNVLHLISCDGKFKRILAELEFIHDPWSVASDRFNNLYVGTTGGLIHFAGKE